MKKIYFFLMYFILVNFFNCQSEKLVNNITDLFDRNWKIISKIEGDLNKDGLNDIALVIENTDKNNFIKNEFLGSDTLNINPRRIIIALKKNKQYLLKVDNMNFIPSPNDQEASCLADPFEDSLTIEKGVLKVGLNFWYSCGSWFTNINTYTFRYQNDKFELIGYDIDEMHRASGEQTTKSINYQTKIKIVTTGLNIFNESNPKVKKYRIKEKKLYNLNNLDLNDIFISE